MSNLRGYITMPLACSTRDDEVTKTQPFTNDEITKTQYVTEKMLDFRGYGYIENSKVAGKWCLHWLNLQRHLCWQRELGNGHLAAVGLSGFYL